MASPTIAAAAREVDAEAGQGHNDLAGTGVQAEAKERALDRTESTEAAVGPLGLLKGLMRTR
jgi:hypothetical protein